MATKLFPPMIESKLPAFAGAEMRIPFTMNRAVGLSQVKQMSVIIKTSQTGTIIADGLLGSYSYSEETKNYTAVFNLGDLYSKTLASRKVSPGQYYKVQIAYVDANGLAGYYSTAGIIKCTTVPFLEILSLNSNYYGIGSYTGQYSQSGDDKDGSEKVYSYQFFLRDAKDNIVATSGEQIHDYSDDTDTTVSQDTWNLTLELVDGVPYYISYKVTTMNGYVTESQRYVITQSESIDPNLPCKLIAVSNFDDGCTQLFIRPIANKPLNGSFVLSRASSEDNYGTWNKIYSFSYKSVLLSPRDPSTHPGDWGVNDTLIWEDFTTKQGVEYKYAIQAYNSKGLYSSRVLNTIEYLDESYQYNPDLTGVYHTVFRHNPVYVDFEDSFLMDGERQLKLRFNPKVSSFKSNRLEAKMDTIGGKYPFIFRNGNVEYKEFQISGLISLLSDESNDFLSNLFVEDYNNAGSWLTADNYMKERQFKMMVLNWLNNGKPKLFKSPAEGNFIVRLINISMTPNDTLGRMLHTFTCTANEIAEYTFENLRAYSFTVPQFTDTKTLKIAQINLNDVPEEMQNGDEIVIPSAVMASVKGNPNAEFIYYLANSMVESRSKIGLTGAFYFPNEVLLANPLVSLSLSPDTSDWGKDATLTYGYYDTIVDSFSHVYNIDITDRMVQMIGPGNDVNITTSLNDFRRKLGVIHYLRVQPRDQVKIYRHQNEYYYNNSGDKVTTLHPNSIYVIINDLVQNIPDKFEHYIDGRDGHIRHSIVRDMSSLSFDFKLNGTSHADFSGANALTTGRYEALTNLNSIDYISAGEGLILDMVYQEKEILYVVEVPNSGYEHIATIGAKTLWQNAENKYLGAVASNAPPEMLNTYKEEMDAAYADYVYILEMAVNTLKEGHDVDYAL